MEQIEYLRILRRRWRVIAAAILLGVAATFLATPAQPVAPSLTYTATHTLYKDPGQAVPGMSLGTMALLTTTGEVPRRVAERIGFEGEAAILATQVNAAADVELGVLRVAANGTDPEATADLADAFAEETLRYVEERSAARTAQLREGLDAQLRRQKEIERVDRQMAGATGVDAEVLRSQRDALIRTYGFTVEQLQTVSRESASDAGVVTLESAVAIPAADDGLQAPQGRGSRVALAALIAAVLGCVLAIVLDRLDVRVRTRGAAQAAFGLPVIAEIPKVRGFKRHHSILLLKRPGSYAAESFRMLRLSLQMYLTPGAPDGRDDLPRRFASSASEGQVVLVTSAGPSEGKTTTVANLAASFAEVGKRVLVLDVDFRHAQQHRYFGCEREPGMSDYLTRDTERLTESAADGVPGNNGTGTVPPRTPVGTTLRLADLVQPSSVAPGVSVVPNGTPVDNPGELIGPESTFLREARQLADVVVVDAGPLLSVNDPIALMPHVDMVVLVARAGRTTAEMANRTAEVLKRSNAPVVGVSLVEVTDASSRQPYYAQVRSAPVDRNWRRRRSEKQTKSGV